LLHRPLLSAAMAMSGRDATATMRNVHRLFEAFQLSGGKPLRRSLARQLLALPHGLTLDAWLDNPKNKPLAADLGSMIATEIAPLPAKAKAEPPQALTYSQTARRSFEVAYWKTISDLSEGTLLNKNNADCVLDAVTQRLLPYHDRHLENLGDFLLAYYDRKIVAAGLTGKALAGEVPFRWRTDFDFSWMGGWCKNQNASAERDILVVIPGRDRSQAVIMADHYDTAYMVDKFDPDWGGCGARIAACGADDNHSATAAMMLAAPIFLQMSRRGQLNCDIWLVHLTGEEFPADCLGARALTQRLVGRTLKLHLPGGKTKDLSKTTVGGLYVSDMIAHNNDRERDIFQISPGNDAASFRLARHAHVANEIWNASVPHWNRNPERAGRPPGRRSPHGGAIPEVAPFLAPSGQVRLASDPRSTLYNTDGQIFSDAGVPCVLFMENYDINRTGYHDTHDTMENIDLDYGSAVCAITIEAVARAAILGDKEID
jgi:Peptidase family M28